MADHARYHSDWGPKDGPIRYQDSPGCIGVLVPDGKGPLLRLVGIAYPAGWIADPKGRGPLAAYRLEVAGKKLEGRWNCRAREFVRVDETGS